MDCMSGIPDMRCGYTARPIPSGAGSAAEIRRFFFSAKTSASRRRVTLTRTSPTGGAWNEAFRVRSYETDQHGRLSILSFCHLLQEAAGNHARALGVGIESLNDRNLTWMLSRIRMAVRRLPAAGEAVTIRTWPSGTDRLFALRDFIAQAGDGTALASADSAWLVIDRTRRRPVRLEPFLERIRSAQAPPVLEKPIPPVPAAGEAAVRKTLNVRYRDLDANRHVNNVTYVEWIQEGFPPAFFDRRRLSFLEVEFRAEALAGDTVFCTHRPDPVEPETYLHSVFRKTDERELARARTGWEKTEGTDQGSRN
jgi:acyl-ACP thioesterase